MKVLQAALLYFTIVFGIGFILGPIRVLVVAPAFGEAGAVLCEAPILLAVMWYAARYVPHRVGIPDNRSSMVTMGILAAALVLAADFLVGFALRGMTWDSQFAYLRAAAGLVYLALVVGFALMPAFANSARQRT